jgi:hypothetical protein
MVRALFALAALVAILPCAFAQDAPAIAAADIVDDANRVIVQGKSTRKMVYDFYRKLSSKDFCPRGFSTPRGHSCAEVTYEVFSADGKSLGKCNIPIFRLYEYRAQYTALTYEKLDCSKTPDGKTLAPVGLEELFNPTTKDGTVFRKIGVMGLDEAKDLCKVSEDACVIKLFDREKELSFCALQYLWGLLPPRVRCAAR